jgi:hypothetical protein
LDGKPVDLGFGPHTLQTAVEDLCQDLDPFLLQRKGRLMLLASESADPQALTWVCRDYYGSRSFDVIPTLVHSLTQAYRDHPGLESHLFLIAVQRGLDVSMVGNAQAAVRLARYNVVRDLYDPEAGNTGYRVAMTEHPSTRQAPALYSTVWRVVKGDVLLFTVRSVAERISAAALTRVARQGGTAQAAAQTLGRRLRGAERAPLIVIRYDQIAPVPDVPAPVRSDMQAPPAPKPHVRRQGVSPVLIAGLVALLAVVVSAWVTGTRIRPAEIPGYLKMYFFPDATPTPAATPLAGQEGDAERYIIYGAPELVTPYDGARVSGVEVALVWDWPQDLAESERFEVIVRPPGGDAEGRTLTRERRHTISRSVEGWYVWTVRVVDVSDGESATALSPRAEEVSFHWGAD